MDAPVVEYGREPEHREHSSHRPRHREEARGYSRSRSPSISRGRYRSSRRRSRSRSPGRERDHPSRRRDFGRPREHRPVRDNPTPSEVLGVFGLSSYTREDDLEKLFGEYGRIEQVRIIYDRRTDVSRGFGFINFSSVHDATVAKQKLDGLRLHERCIRVDYSITQRAHSPTPGEYMGDRRPPLHRSSRRSRSRSPVHDGRRHRSDYGYSR